ncbi:MAG TPA: methyltransferase domain-containing protein [Candidatus Limnocylindrales bacterium]|nr:methyltransferase domain-containing protein [Candidatus Limnocylindrales bacterium]
MTDEPQIRETITATWDAGAGTYDDHLRHGILHEDEGVAWSRLATAIFGDPRRTEVPIKRVLDVGTGTGLMALLAAELGHDVTGLDASEGMLDRARRKARDLHLDVRWDIGDAEDPPYAPGTFDILVSRHVTWTLLHPAETFERWSTLVRPGGLIVILDGSSSAGGPVARLAKWLVRRRSGGNDHAYPDHVHHSLPLAHGATPAAIARLMREAGIGDVKVRPLTEIERVERSHMSRLERLADTWIRFMATGRRPLT